MDTEFERLYEELFGEEQNAVVHQVEVMIAHRRRGGAGQYEKISEGEAIRVTVPTGKRANLEKVPGKNLRLTVRLPPTLSRAQISNIYLIDLDDTPSGGKGDNPLGSDAFSINAQGGKVSANPDGGVTLEYEIKVTKLGRRLQFVVWIQTNDPTNSYIRACSVFFETHNDGNRNRRKLAREAKEAAKTQHLTSPVSPLISPLSSPNYQQVPSEEEEIEGDLLPETKKRKLYVPNSPPNGHTTFNTNLQVEGSMVVNGSVRAYEFVKNSDIRLKTNIQELVDALEIVLSLQGKSYHWKQNIIPNEVGGRRVIGMIAQEVQQVLPEIVYQDPQTGYLSVSYSSLVPIIIEAFKQHVKVVEQTTQHLQRSLDVLNAKVDRITMQVAEPPRFIGPLIRRGRSIENGDDSSPVKQEIEDEETKMVELLHIRRKATLRYLSAQLRYRARYYNAQIVIVVDWHRDYLYDLGLLVECNSRISYEFVELPGSFLRRAKVVFMSIEETTLPMSYSIAIDLYGTTIAQVQNSRAVVTVLDLREHRPLKSRIQIPSRTLKDYGGNKWMVGRFTVNPFQGISWLHQYNYSSYTLPPDFRLPLIPLQPPENPIQLPPPARKCSHVETFNPQNIPPFAKAPRDNVLFASDKKGIKEKIKNEVKETKKSLKEKFTKKFNKKQ